MWTHRGQAACPCTCSEIPTRLTMGGTPPPSLNRAHQSRPLLQACPESHWKDFDSVLNMKSTFPRMPSVNCTLWGGGGCPANSIRAFECAHPGPLSTSLPPLHLLSPGPGLSLPHDAPCPAPALWSRRFPWSRPPSPLSLSSPLQNMSPHRHRGNSSCTCLPGRIHCVVHQWRSPECSKPTAFPEHLGPRTKSQSSKQEMPASLATASQGQSCILFSKALGQSLAKSRCS